MDLVNLPVSRTPGPGDILSLLRRLGPRTRGDLQELTGLSRMAVTQRVTPLLNAGYIVETEDAEFTGGRRAARLAFNGDFGFFAVEAMETTRARTAITDLDGRVVALAESDADVKVGAEKSLSRTLGSIRELAKANGIDFSQIQGIGLSLPGPIDPVTMRPSEPPIMPGWDNFPVADYVTKYTGKPARVENDANAMALGIQRLHYPACRSLVLIKVGTGIGSGFVIGGDLYPGVDGGAGDIGHIRVSKSSEKTCRCGAQGCLAASASGWSVAEDLAAKGYEAKSGHDVRALLDRGDTEAVRLVREAGRVIGIVGASIVSMLNPEILVLAGDLASTPLLGGFRETLYSETLPRATKSIQVVVDDHPDSAIRGMSQSLADQVFSASQVNVAIAG